MNVEYREEPAVVKEVRDGQAVLKLQVPEGKSCGSCCACAAYSNREFEMEVPDQHFQTGQKVVVRLPVISRALSTLVLLVMPLGAFIAGVVAGQFVHIDGMETSVVSVLGGVIGLGAAIVAAALINSRLTRRHPVQVRPVTDAQSADDEEGQRN